MSESCALAEWEMPAVYSLISSGVTSGRLRNSLKPMTALSGVRISWDIVARNIVLARAAWLAARAEATSCSRCVSRASSSLARRTPICTSAHASRNCSTSSSSIGPGRSTR